MAHKFCLSILLFVVGVSPLWGQTRSEKSAVLGGIAGAIIGGVAGHQNHETAGGVAIGGIVGAIAGGVLGRSQDVEMMRANEYRQYQQQQYTQQIDQSVSLNDAVQMIRNGLSPNLVINQIRTNGVRQKIGVQEIIMLHKNGVPENVIQEMQNARIAGTATRNYRTPAQVPTYSPVVIDRRPQIIFETTPIIGGHWDYHTPYRAPHYSYRHTPIHEVHHHGSHHSANHPPHRRPSPGASIHFRVR